MANFLATDNEQVKTPQGKSSNFQKNYAAVDFVLLKLVTPLCLLLKLYF